MTDLTYTLPFSKIKMNDILQVGGKNASLGEMIQNLTPLGIDVPDGFAITVDAYNYFIKEKVKVDFNLFYYRLFQVKNRWKNKFV